MELERKAGIWTGALVGVMLTAPLIALLYLADQLAGLPFVVFDIFDWLARTLPGDIVTAGIDTIVDFIRMLNLGDTASTAKTLEQVLALGLMMLIGIAVGAILFAWFRSSESRDYYFPGLAVGLLLGAVAAVISNAVNVTATTGLLVSTAWILIVFMAWGAGFSWIYSDLADIEAEAGVEGADIEAVQLNRREFLVRVGGATAVLTVAGAVVSLLLDGDAEVVEVAEGPLPTVEPVPSNLPNADADVQPVPGTRPEYTPLEDHYRIDINARPPEIDADGWRLSVTGLVAEPLRIALDELRDNYEPVHHYITLSCISNPIGGDLISTTRWTGVPLTRLLDDWNLEPDGRFLKITAADSFDEFISVDLIRSDERIMLCYAWDGKPLEAEHGFPLRIYIPDRYGMKQPKWITDIEVVATEEEGYWVRRGWSQLASVRLTSVIDTVAAEHAIERDGQLHIPIGGIAHSGAKGISRVEVQVDDGDWVEAELREPISGLTWVIWRYEWPFEPGMHAFRVRCYDDSGTGQIERRQGVRPDGATGIHSVRRSIRESEEA